jgi:hypothetical protein
MAAGRPHGNPMTARRLCWAARIVGTGAIAFLSLFALDAFQPGVPQGVCRSALRSTSSPALFWF